MQPLWQNQKNRKMHWTKKFRKTAVIVDENRKPKTKFDKPVNRGRPQNRKSAVFKWENPNAPLVYVVDFQLSLSGTPLFDTPVSPFPCRKETSRNILSRGSDGGEGGRDWFSLLMEIEFLDYCPGLFIKQRMSSTILFVEGR